MNQIVNLMISCLSVFPLCYISAISSWVLKTVLKLCFRQSIDLYSSVPSPSLNFLGTPTLSRLSSSYLSSSLTRRHTPEILPSLAKPLLPTVEDEQQPQQRRSSHSLLPPIHSKKPPGKKTTHDQKSSKGLHEVPVSGQSSFGQAVLNGMLCKYCSICSWL